MEAHTQNFINIKHKKMAKNRFQNLNLHKKVSKITQIPMLKKVKILRLYITVQGSSVIREK